jgi:peptidoglycan/LPS O-acetylase OafA/YrhL
MRVWLSIQYLRGCAALAVVWLHSHLQLERMTDLGPSTQHHGDVGVDLFFVISGFIIWISTDDDRSRPVAFWRRRAIRVVPLYWLCTLAMVILLTATTSLFL